MSKPRHTTINYDEHGNVAGIEHRVMRVGTADFGDGAEAVEKQSIDQLPNSRISAATKTAIKKFLDAFEVVWCGFGEPTFRLDLILADHLKAEAARAVTEAEEAVARAAEKS